MPTAADRGAIHKPGSRSGVIVLALLVGLIAGAGVLVTFAHKATNGVWNRIATRMTGRRLLIDTSQSTVVTQIKRLERLETVTYTMDKVVEGQRSSAILPDFLVGDKLLLLVHGEAIAGVDLRQLQPSDVAVHGRNVDVHLPPAQVFITALDDSRTRVFSRSTGWFVQADPNLESEVRSLAEQNLRSSALASGILSTAHNNAASTLTKLLLGLGFEKVNVH